MEETEAQPAAHGYDLLLTYSTKEVMSYEEIHEAIGKIIERLNQIPEPTQP